MGHAPHSAAIVTGGGNLYFLLLLAWWRGSLNCIDCGDDVDVVYSDDEQAIHSQRIQVEELGREG